MSEINVTNNYKMLDTDHAQAQENTTTNEISTDVSVAIADDDKNVPLYIPEIKEKFGIEVDEDNLKRFSDYKSAYDEYEQVKPILDDEEIKQILEFKKQGGSINDFIEATQIDISKYSDEDLIKMQLQNELQENGITKDLDLITNAKYKKLFANAEKEIDSRIEEIDEELQLGEDDDLIQEKSQLLLKKSELEIAKNDIISKQKEKLESKKINLLNKHKESQNFETEMEAKIDTFKQGFNQKLNQLDTKLNFNDGKISFDLDKKELLGISENIVLQETMEDGKTPFVWLKGIDSEDITKALSVYKNLDKIVSDAIVKKELELDALYNNRQIPNLKNKHIEGNEHGRFRIIG